ncbi:MAG: P1 family peptidase [Oribacterium sp.]|nr:P1 family peptidase [Oribacterium sp.]
MQTTKSEDNTKSTDSSKTLLPENQQSDEIHNDSGSTAYREIPVTEIGDINIGQTENKEAGTGLTVFISKEGMPAGLDVRGGGPASRESEMLDPLAAMQEIHAIVLAGGSAFGLEAANGVMEYLEKNDIGYDTGYARVPLVVQSDLYDLSVGDSTVRPDSKMGYEAAKLACETPNYRDGNFGAGCGASVGKIAGMETAMKSGIGSYAIEIGELKIGAVVAVNALGDIYDWRTGEKLAGLLTEDKQGFRDTLEYMAQDISSKENKFTGNTTIGVVISNASFNKSQLCKIAGMAHNGYARSIRPVHTSADGDSIYAVSVGNLDADQDLVGSYAALVMSEAIKRAVMNSESQYGLISATDFRNQ